MHRKPVVILLLLCAITFGNALRNGFVGDDNFLILQNEFYSSFSNIKDLFTSRYLTGPAAAISPADTARYFSGSVAYRPVLSLTYFWDYALWKEQPFGYHFTSLLWHTANTLLVYWLIFLVSGQAGVAFWAAAIFAVHPFKSEAVCAISYRADLVAALFVLLGMIAHVQFRRRREVTWAAAAHTAFFLAVFAKEAAIVFPGMVFCYDRFCVRREEQGDDWRRFIVPYAGYAAIGAFYIYIYLFVFRNEQAASVTWLGGSPGMHLIKSVQILAGYVTGLFLPFVVKVLPPVYLPPMTDAFVLTAALTAAIVALTAWTSVLFSRRGSANAFFIGWFWLTLIPVSNLIPLVNPMAHRFMYLPSVGMAFMLAVFLHAAGEWMNARLRSRNFVTIFAGAYLLAAMIIAIRINAAWRHDYIMAYRLYQNHPRDPVSHLFMGLTYVRIGEPEKAERVILDGIRLGLDDPRVYYILALSRKNDYDLAAGYLNKGVSVYPDYPMLYLGLGRTYLMKGDLVRARQALRQCLALQPSYRAYNYLFQVLLLEKDAPGLAALQREISAVMRDPQYDAFLAKTLQIKDTLTLPEDNGF